jgi:hypothetical protein
LEKVQQVALKLEKETTTTSACSVALSCSTLLIEALRSQASFTPLLTSSIPLLPATNEVQEK